MVDLLISVLRKLAPVALGAIGATLLVIYPEGFQALCVR